MHIPADAEEEIRREGSSGQSLSLSSPSNMCRPRAVPLLLVSLFSLRILSKSDDVPMLLYLDVPECELPIYSHLYPHIRVSNLLLFSNQLRSSWFEHLKFLEMDRISCTQAVLSMFFILNSNVKLPFLCHADFALFLRSQIPTTHTSICACISFYLYKACQPCQPGLQDTP